LAAFANIFRKEDMLSHSDIEYCDCRRERVRLALGGGFVGKQRGQGKATEAAGGTLKELSASCLCSGISKTIVVVFSGYRIDAPSGRAE